MRLVITLTAYRRPEYTRQVLDALTRCDGIEGCLLLAHVEPSDTGVADIVRSFRGCPVDVTVNRGRLGLNLNAREALAHAAGIGAEAVWHLEDDTVPSPDAIRYVRWGLRRLEVNPMIFSVACYNRPETEPAPEQSHQAYLRPWFTCWGWAVDAVRLAEILRRWCAKNPRSFAWNVNKGIRDQRQELAPVLSRIQNIGYEDGENGRSPDWYRENHRTEYVAADLPPRDYHVSRVRVPACSIPGFLG